MRAPDPPERRERRRERMHPFLRFLNRMMTLSLVLAIGAAAIVYFIKRQFDEPGPAALSTVVVIPKGEGLSGIADQLERDQVIADRRIFITSMLYFKYFKGKVTLKAGEYEFRKHATMRQVLDTMVEGKSIDHKVNLAEGLTSQQMMDRLKANPDLQGDITEVPPEGSLLPDTYRFQLGDTRQDIIDRMKSAQQKALAKMWEERDPDIALTSPDQAVVLASIVEKETSRADERPHIASVFQNRLRKNMRLQSDPTVIYGLSNGKGILDHPLQEGDLDRDTPFNTYKINGLPPTPIGNPGRASLAAVLNPSKTKDLYFVADGTGGHAFAPTLEEHNKNVAHWRQIEREQAAKAQAAAQAQAAATIDPNTLNGQPASPDAASVGAPAPEAGGVVVSVPLPTRNPKR